MDSLPDFTQSKIEIRNRIEGALRVKRKRHPLHQYALFMGLFLFTSLCSTIYFRGFSIFKLQTGAEQLDIRDLENLLLSEQLESESVIKLPANLSLLTAGEAVIMSDARQGNYE